jgi:hypothetical protein
MRNLFISHSALKGHLDCLSIKLVDVTHTSGSKQRRKSYVALYFIHLPFTLKLFSLCFTQVYTVSLARKCLLIANKLRNSDGSTYGFIIR